MPPLPTPTAANKLAYAVPKPATPIDLHLDANEGCVPLPELFDVLRARYPDDLRRYPSAAPLQSALAQRLSLEAPQLIITAGTDEAIDRACRAFLCAGRDLLLPLPTFEMIPKYADLTGARTITLPWFEPGEPFPTQHLLARITPQTGMIAIVTPNNPTGACATPDDLKQLALAAPHALILLDMAYGEFADEPHLAAMQSQALRHDNVLITRTFSKAWGLAGLRVGYAIGHPAVISTLRAVAGPYPCAAASLALAHRWLELGRDHVSEFIAAVRRERAALAQHLTTLAADPNFPATLTLWPSQGNFIFLRLTTPDGSTSLAPHVQSSLAAAGIAVRAYPARTLLATTPDNQPTQINLDPTLRITCPGNSAHVERLTAALTTAFATLS